MHTGFFVSLFGFHCIVQRNEKRLLGITAMSQTLGRKKFEELLGGLVYKPPGKPVLVPESDKRPAMNTAINDFKENEEDNNYGKDRK